MGTSGVLQDSLSRPAVATPFVVASSVQKILGERVISFSVETVPLRAGELTMIVGDSGCGKSTLMRILALQDRSFHGRLTMLGEDVRSLDDRAIDRLRSDALHFIPQKHLGLLARSPVENIATWLIRLDGFSPSDARWAAEQALDAVGIERRQFHEPVMPPAFSGGQQARVAVACALARRRPICLADEVVAGLDWKSQKLMLALLRKHIVDCGGTVAIVWHLPDDRLGKLPDSVRDQRFVPNDRPGGLPDGLVDHWVVVPSPPD